MNPNYGYQLYQAQRVRTRAEIIADDARRGNHAAKISTTRRATAGTIKKAIATLSALTTGVAAGSRAH